MASLVSGQTSAPLSSIIHADRNHRRFLHTSHIIQDCASASFSSSLFHLVCLLLCRLLLLLLLLHRRCSFLFFSLLFLLLFNLFLYFSTSILFIVFLCSSFSL